jgi:hypothetical protein
VAISSAPKLTVASAPRAPTVAIGVVRSPTVGSDGVQHHVADFAVRHRPRPHAESTAEREHRERAEREAVAATTIARRRSVIGRSPHVATTGFGTGRDQKPGSAVSPRRRRQRRRRSPAAA